MTPQLLHAEVDYFQVAIIVLAVIFSFVKWLWDQWTGNKTQEVEFDENVDQREELRRQIQEQARRRAAAAPQPPPIPSAPPPAPVEPWQEIRKAWRELREAAQAQKPAQPPPVPVAQRRQNSPRKPAEVSSPPKPAEVASTAAPPPAATVPTSPPAPMLASLRALRHDPAAMRRAIVLGEVLGPPKALQG